MTPFFARLFGRSAPTAPIGASPATPEQGLADLRDRIRSDVAAGFDDEDAILARVGDCFEDEIDPAVVRGAAPRLLREELAAHARAAAGWPAVTDCDRLDTAFAALEASGIVARQNFTCCMTCGSSEIWAEIDTAIDAGAPAQGYVFYHSQDTEAAVNGRGVYLAYGACDEGDTAALEVARRIVAQLQAEGLAPEWNGSRDQRIALPLDWARRRS